MSVNCVGLTPIVHIYKSTETYKKFRWVADYLRSIYKREIKDDNVASSEAFFRLDEL